MRRDGPPTGWMTSTAPDGNPPEYYLRRLEISRWSHPFMPTEPDRGPENTPGKMKPVMV